MKSKRLGLRAIGLCLALAGLMAVSASVAQADPNSYWLVNGVKVTTLLPELQGSLENNHGVLLGTIGGTPIEILCTGLSYAVGNHLLTQGGWLGKEIFSGCLVFSVKSGALQKTDCLIPGEVIVTTALKGLIKLHNGTPILLSEPNVGTTFATITMGEECPFGDVITIHGKLAVKDCENAFLTDKVTHLREEFAPLTELYLNGNKANKLTFDGSVLVSLAGAHKGLTWAGHPE